MIDKDKVIKSIECCLRPNNTNLCGECSYKDVTYNCKHALIKDVYELLKEQKPVKAIPTKMKVVRTYNDIEYNYCCGGCSSLLRANWVACPICGKVVKWDD